MQCCPKLLVSPSICALGCTAFITYLKTCTAAIASRHAQTTSWVGWQNGLKTALPSQAVRRAAALHGRCSGEQRERGSYVVVSRTGTRKQEGLKRVLFCPAFERKAEATHVNGSNRHPYGSTRSCDEEKSKIPFGLSSGCWKSLSCVSKEKYYELTTAVNQKLLFHHSLLNKRIKVCLNACLYTFTKILLVIFNYLLITFFSPLHIPACYPYLPLKVSLAPNCFSFSVSSKFEHVYCFTNLKPRKLLLIQKLILWLACSLHPSP